MNDRLPEDVTVVRCGDADEWLNAMSPTAPRFRESDPDQWIFRGHRDSTWPLLPSAFREQSWSKVQSFFHGKRMPWEKLTEKQQRLIERNVIWEFFYRADQSGLAIPENSDRMRRLLDHMDPLSVTQNHRRPWPPRELWSLVALAQHYGVPTRLLDWTRSAWTAAYFAIAEEALPESPKKPRPPVRTVHADSPADRSSFDEELRHINHEYGTRGGALLLFTLPTTESARALRLLAKAGVTGAALFPGYAGVVRAMREERAINKDIEQRVKAGSPL